ncbi:MAG: amino acid adenylation domain-containing protein, partial [Anaerolineae bacterium]|nr:amino acid adenylation domain-containing protein [Anaerolineae bacterium]
MNRAANNDVTLALRQSALIIQKLQNDLDAFNQPIAIIGMGCRFPGGVETPDQFWQLLHDGVDAITEVPPERWDVEAYFDPDPDVPRKMHTRYGGFLHQVDGFDAQFFGLSPREVISLDPQQRLLLEVSWEALERAGIAPARLNNTATGVFIGLCSNDYQFLLDQNQTAADGLYLATGNALSVAAGRLAYMLGLTGPSLVIDTACSSSLVTIHQACASLRRGECNLALSGGVNLILRPENTISFSKARMLAPDGRCKTFDAAANGFVRSEGCGVVILKRLANAQVDGDPILAIIRGSMINQDGRSSGLTAPNGSAQKTVILQALKQAQLDPAEVSYIEAHGTGTSLGDPIEIDALSAIFRHRETPLYVGSVKTNIGHLEGAAGVAGLIKTILSLQHKTIPPHLHFQNPNPYIDWETSPIQIPTQLTPWSSDRRIAGVSSFGFSGTNAHVILEEAPSPTFKLPTADFGSKEIGHSNNGVSKIQSPSLKERPYHLLTLSAKSEEALRALGQRYYDYLNSHPDVVLSDVCYTVNTGRNHFRHRLGLVAASVREMQESLGGYLRGNEQTGLSAGYVLEHSPPPSVAFLFSGQGSQYSNMGRELYETHPVFRQTVNRCAEILAPDLDIPLLDVLYPKTQSHQAAKPEGYKNQSPVSSLQSPISQTRYTQPALFALEYALAELWRSWGIRPDFVMGHSVGEIVAACVAGVFSLKEGLKLIAARGRLMQALPQNGMMAAVRANETQVAEAIAAYPQSVSIAAVNGPQNVVISGERHAVETILNRLKVEGVNAIPLPVSHAFHSPLMEPMLDEFEQIARMISYAPPQIRLVSNVTGQLSSHEVCQPEYWVKHVRAAVHFAQGMSTLHQTGTTVFVEIGPKPVLSNLGQQGLTALTTQTQPDNKNNGAGQRPIWLPSLREGRRDWQQMLESLGTLYMRGLPVDWVAFDQDDDHSKGHKSRTMSLPTYPFQRKRYWLHIEEKPIEISPVPSEIESNKSPQLEQAFQGDQLAEITATLRQLIANLLQASPEEIDIHTPFIEMGSDSLILMEAMKTIEQTFGIKIAVRQFFEELSTIDALAHHLSLYVKPKPRQIASAQNPEPVKSSPQSEQLPSVAGVSSELLERLMMKQLEVASQVDSQVASQTVSQAIAQQLEFLNKQRLTPQTRSDPKPTPEPERHDVTDKLEPDQNSKPTTPLWRVANINASSLTTRQQEHLNTLIQRYTARTKTSRQFTQEHRPILADNRASAGFRFSTKKMLYPIVGSRSQGSRLWDVDGNEYIDLTMGFGVHLFGHNPPFVTQALTNQINEGMQLGPQAGQAGEVARLISSLTGAERVGFCSTGTEAVMTALRLARAKTKRHKIALFAGAYHGHFDGVLGMSMSQKEATQPFAPGIHPDMVKDLLILPYDSPEALDVIHRQRHELAAVLVEPVQSRRPELQPRQFLHQLRQLTHEANIPLIFDEMITGFRILPGGAQAWFEIEADLMTYGKIVGGGLPIGVIAGKAALMDGLDGGMWTYDDDSYPAADTTFFAGTYNKNPLTMAAAQAVLNQIKLQGSSLYEQLNEKTTHFANRLNHYFETTEVPIKIVHFGSLFRFSFASNLDLLFYHLLERGIYIWEGRNCFLSTAHTDEDLEYVTQAIQDTIEELRQAGFLPPTRYSGIPKYIPEPASPPSSSPLPTEPDDIPLTEAQQQLWVLSQIDEQGSLAYNTFVAAQLKGRLNLEAMHQAVQHVVARHEALRLTIDPQGAHQRVHSRLEIEVPLLDFSELRGQTQEPAITEWLTRESQQPFDLNRGPLLRVNILKLDRLTHLLALSAHHIIVDGLSMGLILQDTSAFYSAECQGQSINPAPALQLSDYVRWQEEQRNTEAMLAQETYWLEQLTAPLPVLELPTDHPRPPIKNYRGRRTTRYLDMELVEALKTLSKKQHTTFFMTCLAAYLAMLHRLTGQADIIVGIPTAGRSLAGGETLVGYCTHLLPIRSRLVGQPTFAAYLAQIKNVLLDAYEHGDVPYARLLNKLNIPRQANRSPLVNMVFNLDRASQSANMFDLEFDFYPTPHNFTHFDMSLNLTDLADKLVVECDYDTDLFDEATIERFLSHYQTLLSEIVADPAQPITRLPLLSKSERQQLLIDWNTLNTPTDYPLDQCLPQLFEEQVERTPNAVAAVYQDRRLTYHQLNQQANRLAHYLRSIGVGPETLVGLCIQRSPEMVVGLLAILKAGGAYVPLDPSYPPERLAFMMADAQLPMIICHSSFAAQLQLISDTEKPYHLNNSGERRTNLSLSYKNDCDFVKQYEQPTVICIDTLADRLSQESPDNLLPRTTPDNLAYVIYTSGSTGRPKGTLINHRSLTNYLSWCLQTYHPEQGTGAPINTALGFDATITSLFSPLLAGKTIVLLPESDEIETLGQLLQQDSDFSLVKVTPAHLKVLEQLRVSGEGTQAFIIGGEALFGNQLIAWRQQNPTIRLVNEYGPTETVVGCCVYEVPLNFSQTGPVPIGKPIANIQLYVLDHHLEPVPVGVPGELYIGGIQLARGYHQRPALTAEKFIPNPFPRPISPNGKTREAKGERLYKTGDLARYLPDGNLEFLGRRDEQVKLRGFRVELGEVEANLSQHPGVRTAVAAVQNNQLDEQQLVAYIVPDRIYQETTQGDSAWQSEQVADWQSLYNEIYNLPEPLPDPTFNLAGWNSTYTGQPIPPDEMAIWLEDTVSQIRSLAPQDVLEIGCGTGLLLFQLASGCTRYWATDFSERGLDQLRSHLTNKAWSHVRLFPRRANDFSGLASEMFDTVILNSVVQYFPNEAYLRDVLRQAVQVVKPGGAIFVGDVRSLPLLEAFHADVQLSQAPAELSRVELQQRVQSQLGREKELVIDPAFFNALQVELPAISGVQIQLKRGRPHNELTQFRYNVVLWVGEPASQPQLEPLWLQWDTESLNSEVVRTCLVKEQPLGLGLKDVPNRRVWAAVQTAAWLAGSSGPETAAEMRSLLAAALDETVVDPQLWYEFGSELGYEVLASWSDHRSLDRCHVLFVKTGLVSSRDMSRLMPATNPADKPVYTNDPLQVKLQKQLETDLRNYLISKLPDYMIPNRYMLLQTVPLTPNGKVDRKSLPALEQLTTTTYVSPRTPTEKTLVTIWQEALRVDRIGLHDNFFDIGGDSIIAIQITARARQAGLHFNSRDIFQYQTIADLVSVVSSSTANAAEQGLITGHVSLTPIQHWFFEQKLVELHHFNQAVLLEIETATNPLLIAQALEQLIQHHDALRLRFALDDTGWRQWYADPAEVTILTPNLELANGDTSLFSCINLDHLPLQEQDDAVERHAEIQQSTLNLTDGPIMRLTLFQLGSDRPARLLWVIHHLVVDGVSWRILLEDFATAYHQLQHNQPVNLPPKTTSFKAWADGINALAQTDQLAAETAYWAALPQGVAPPLPVDDPTGLASNNVASTARLSRRLSPQETQTLLQKAPSAYHTQINDLLLTALVQTFAHWTGEAALWLDLEGHGRETPADEALDLSRTVGWFTSIFPVLLRLDQLESEPALSPGEAIKSIKEQLRQVPQRGIGYGIRRYLSQEPALTRLPPAQVSFNYLGQFDNLRDSQAVGSLIVGLAQDQRGSERSPRQIRSHLLEVEGLVIDGRLQFDWTYSRNIHHHNTIQQLADHLIDALRALIAHCLSPESGGYTPSDFAVATITQRQLDQLLTAFNAKNDLEDIYDLSHTQQGMLFETLLAPTSGVYIDQLCLTLTGSLDVSAWQRAWQQIIARHPILRTSFHWAELDTPLQVVHSQAALPWTVLDWRELSEPDQTDRLEAWLQRDRQQGFELDQAPLMRLTLIRVSPETVHFIWSHHHLILDGWCLPLILNEVRTFYEAASNGQSITLPPPRLYRDYIQWLQQQNITQAETYWRKTLSGFTAPTPLTLERRTVTREGAPVAHHIFDLPASTMAALHTLTRRHRLTLNTLFQGAWALLLSRYSDQVDVVFGATVAGRPPELTGIETMVGVCINTIPVRLRIPTALTLLEWLYQMQTQHQEREQYAHSALADIQNWSEVPPGQSLFESLLVFENYPFDDAVKQPLGNLRVQTGQMFAQTNYPLTMVVMPATKLMVRLTYDPSRFAKESIEQLAHHLQHVLASMIEHLEDPIQQLSLLTKTERHQILVAWNETQAEYSLNQGVHHLFETQVERSPDAVALVDGEHRLTYQTLNQRANQLAHYLRQLGVGPGMPVALGLSSSVEAMIGLWAILKAGAAYVPLNPDHPAARLARQLNNLAPPVLLTNSTYHAAFSSFQGATLCLDQLPQTVALQPTTNLDLQTTSDQPVYIIYTSGSTGLSKGVVVSHQNLINYTHFIGHRLNLMTANQACQRHFALVSTLTADLGHTTLFPALLSGGCLHLLPYEVAVDGHQFAHYVSRQPIDVLKIVPSHLSSLLSTQPDQMNILPHQFLILGGEALSFDLVERIAAQANGCRVFNHYGPTETTVGALMAEVNLAPSQPRISTTVPIGQPLANTQIYILDGQGQPVPRGLPGELYIGGAGVAQGYLNQPALTAERFMPNPFGPGRLYRTGDRVRYLPGLTNGADAIEPPLVEFLGRTDYQVKIRGFRIELGEIEAALRQHPDLEDCVITAPKNPEDDQHIVAYVVVGEGLSGSNHAANDQFLTTELRDYLKQHLPDYMIPAAFVRLEQLPLTPNGKVNRQALIKPNFEPSQASAAPRTATEARLVAIWQEVLPVKHVGIYDNFFEIGGHSLIATQIISRIRRHFDLDLPLRTIFDHPHIAALAKNIQSAQQTILPPIEPINRTKNLSLSFSQQRLWFLDQLRGPNATYNLFFALKISGRLDVAALTQTLN